MNRAAGQLKKKANLQMLFHPNNLCFPLRMAEIPPTLLIISLKLSEVLFNNSDNPQHHTGWNKGSCLQALTSWRSVQVNAVGQSKLSTCELLCAMQNSTTKTTFKKRWGTNVQFCLSYGGILTTRTECQGRSQVNALFFSPQSKLSGSPAAENSSSAPAIF